MDLFVSTVSKSINDINRKCKIGTNVTQLLQRVKFSPKKEVYTSQKSKKNDEHFSTNTMFIFFHVIYYLSLTVILDTFCPSNDNKFSGVCMQMLYVIVIVICVSGRLFWKKFIVLILSAICM